MLLRPSKQSGTSVCALVTGSVCASLRESGRDSVIETDKEVLSLTIRDAHLSICVCHSVFVTGASVVC